MAEVIHLHIQDQWQLSADLFRRSDGRLVLRLSDVRVSLLESIPGNPGERLLKAAELIEQGLPAMKADAIALTSETESA